MTEVARTAPTRLLWTGAGGRPRMWTRTTYRDAGLTLSRSRALLKGSIQSGREIWLDDAAATTFGQVLTPGSMEEP